MENMPTVPGYELVELLGVGASSRVWRGRPAGGGADVAIKVVREGERAEREVAVLRSLRHEHVVPLLDCVTLLDGSLALVLDVVDGGTLAQLVAARGHLRPGEVVTVVAPLAATLAELHERGVEHGDLAPGNVLFDREGKPLLSDLGTVRITGEVREERFGTPGYVDPVVMAGGAAGPSSDVYGLGALAWLALTGRTPPGPLLREPLSEAVPGLPEALVNAVEDALDPDPARRPDPAALARRVFDALPAEPVWFAGRAPADGGLTHRIRQLAAAEHEVDSPARHRAPRRARWGRLGSVVPFRWRAASGQHWQHLRWAGATVAVAMGAVVAVVVGISLLGGHGRLRVLADRPVTPVSTAAPWVSDVGANRPGAVAAVADVTALPQGSSPGATPPAPSRTPDRESVEPVESKLTAQQVEQVVEQLSRTRAAAFRGGGTGGAAARSRVTLPGSVADHQLRTALDDLRRQGVTYRGLALRTRRVTVREVDGRKAGTAAATAEVNHEWRLVVDVVTDVSAYEVVDAQGRVRQRVAARPGTTSTLVLARSGPRWLVAEVQAMATE